MNRRNIVDDVSIGDGVVGLGGALQVGLALPKSAFVRTDIGYTFRSGDGANLVSGSFRMGKLFSNWMVFGGVSGTFSATKGNPVGVSVVAQDPDLPSEEYEGLNNLRPVRNYLRKDLVSVGGGLIWRSHSPVELLVAYNHVVWGRNTAAIRSISAGFVFRSSFLHKSS